MLTITPSATGAFLMVALPAWNADHAVIFSLFFMGGNRNLGDPMKGARHDRIALPFEDRLSAGRLLGFRLRAELGADATVRGLPVLVLALPRGGVAVGAGVARILAAPLDVLVTRKIGYPPRPELGLGAIAEGGDPVYDHALLARIGLGPADLATTAMREREELARRVRVYRAGRPSPDVGGRVIVLVDDGLATGVTARAALRAVRARDAARTILAVPVAPRAAVTLMQREADEVLVLASPATFRSVGEWYAAFGQLSDADVLSLLEQAQGPRRST
jgi:putative phosphoribosyl transferase